MGACRSAVSPHLQDHLRPGDRRRGAFAAEPPLGLESIRRQPTVELVFHIPVVVAIVEAGNAAKTMQVDVGVFSLERIEGPGDQLISQPQSIGTLRLLQRDPDAAPATLGKDAELVRTQSQLTVAPAQEGKAESDQPAIGHKRSVNQPSVELDRQQQFARHHVSLGGSPDVAAHRLAGSELIMRANEPDLDARQIPRP